MCYLSFVTRSLVVLHLPELVVCFEICILNEAAAVVVGLRLHHVLVLDVDSLGIGGNPHIRIYAYTAYDIRP